MIGPKEIEAIAAEQIVFEDGRTLPRVIEAILDRMKLLEGVPAEASVEEGENNGI